MVVSIIKKHWLSVLLFLAGLFYTFAILNSRFDGDFGWQLRFGMETMAGHFPYLDTYTWTYLGRPWVNHEWGGSVLWWLIYRYLGYNMLVLFVSVCIWSVYAYIPRIFKQPITPLSLVISLAALWGASDVLYTRLTIVAPLFFSLLLVTLERIPEKKYYYWWPLLIWVWGALHGSWILAFIVIGIYTFGKLIEQPLARVSPIAFHISPHRWDTKIYLRVLLYSALSGMALVLNPYGIHLYAEVLTYFSSSFYQGFITEWQPAYAYPVIVGPLVFAAITIPFAFLGWYRGKITTSQLLLYLALQYAMYSHKRNLIYSVLITVPILHATLLALYTELRVRPRVQAAVAALAPAVGVFIVTALLRNSLPSLVWHHDVWNETSFLNAQGFPASATLQLRTMARKEPLTLFDQFRWGGFLNWQMPDTLVYIDGRGTVTWAVRPTTTLYQDYRGIIYEPGGLAKLEAAGTNAVLLEQPARQYFRTGFADTLLFSSADLHTVSTPEKSELQKSLELSPRWKQVYSDSFALVWQRL